MNEKGKEETESKKTIREMGKGTEREGGQARPQQTLGQTDRKPCPTDCWPSELSNSLRGPSASGAGLGGHLHAHRALSPTGLLVYLGEDPQSQPWSLGARRDLADLAVRVCGWS